MTQIIDALRDFNPWWEGKFSLEFKERSLYHQIKQFLPLPQIIALTGLRRVGKTTLMKKIIEDTIAGGLDRRNIIFFSFDEFKMVEIRDILRSYELLMEKNLRSEKYLFLMDEIQKVNNWENQLKTIYDIWGENIKVIISGSESLFVRKKSKETLAGRIFEFKVDTLTFQEFLSFKEKNIKPYKLFRKELLLSFKEFTLTSGFPELVGIREKEVVKKYLFGIVEKIVYNDIPKTFKIKDAAVVESLLNILMENPGQILEISGLAKELNISRQTASNYLGYLEKSFLIKKLYNFSRNRRKIERKLKKFYPKIISPDLLYKEDEYSQSKVFEWLLVHQLNGEFFWRDDYKNEVDVVFPQEKPLPVEIKYGKVDYAGLMAFMKKFKIDEGYIISFQNEEEKKIDNKIIRIIPAFQFLLEKEKTILKR